MGDAEALKPKPNPDRELKAASSLRRRGRGKQGIRPGGEVEDRNIGRPRPVVNNCIAEIQTGDDALRRIELDYAADVNDGRGEPLELKIEWKRAQAGWRNARRGNEIEFALAKTDDAGPDLSEYAPPFKTLPDLHAEQSLGNPPVISSAAKLAPARKEEPCPFQRDVFVEVVGKSATQTQLSLSRVKRDG